MSYRVCATLCLSAVFLAGLPSVASAGYIGVQVKLDDNGKGIFVNQVLADSPAEKAGVKDNDIITHVGDDAVSDLKGLIDRTKGINSGAEVKLTIFGENRRSEFRVKSGTWPTERKGLKG